jgi:hypothetical protein
MISRPLYEALAEHLVGAATARAAPKPAPEEVHLPPPRP